MATEPYPRNQPRLEPLEARLALSLPPSANTLGLNPPANTIGLSEGDVARPGGVANVEYTADDAQKVIDGAK